jgi:hypothetical protein
MFFFIIRSFVYTQDDKGGHRSFVYTQDDKGGHRSFVCTQDDKWSYSYFSGTQDDGGKRMLGFRRPYDISKAISKHLSPSKLRYKVL